MDENMKKRIAEIKAEENKLELERLHLTGKAGLCSVCGEEGGYADSELKICLKCYNERKNRRIRERYEHLIERKVVDIIVVDGELQGLILEGDLHNVKITLCRWGGESWLEET